MTFGAAALCAAVSFADVESANVVGYETLTIGKGSTKIFSVQFDQLGESTAIPIKDLLKYDNIKGSTASGGSGSDQIWTYKNDAWQKYYFFTKNSKNVWCPLNSTTEVPANVTVSSGESFFFQRSTSATGEATITLSGAVKPLNLAHPVTVDKGSTVMLCNPWPIAFKVKNFTQFYPAVSDIKGSTASGGSGSDQIWTYKNDAWQKYYFFTKNSKNVWCPLNSTTEVGDAVEIEPGAGFFFQRSTSAAGECTLTFKGPEYKAE